MARVDNGDVRLLHEEVIAPPFQVLREGPRFLFSPSRQDSLGMLGATADDPAGVLGTAADDPASMLGAAADDSASMLGTAADDSAGVFCTIGNVAADLSQFPSDLGRRDVDRRGVEAEAAELGV